MNYNLLHILIAAVLFLLTAHTARGEELSFRPTVHGTFRAAWELNADDGTQRFQVRNARLSLGGHVLPAAEYFLQVDFCDLGSMKIMDAYARISATNRLKFKFGQFVIPFRNPQRFVFANRSFTAKKMMTYRAVGAQAGYTFAGFPLTVEAGMFNPATIGNQEKWHRTFTWSGRAKFTPGKWEYSLGFASAKPYDIRANLVDVSVAWNDRLHWKLFAEYMFERYSKSAGKPVHTWIGFINWFTGVHLGPFNRLSFQAREEGITDHLELDGSAVDPAHGRITLGATLSVLRGERRCDVRLNYERYIHHDHASEYERNRIAAELVLLF